MATTDQATQTGVILTTALASFVTGYMFGIFTTRGYLISPGLAEERRRYHNDPVESEESDVDEDDTVLDHAPNWANGLDADRRQGLKFGESGAAEKKSLMMDSSEECKLVLVVRTDLGMTKGVCVCLFACFAPESTLFLTDLQAKSPLSAPMPRSPATRPSPAPTRPLSNESCSPAGSASARPRLPYRSRARPSCWSCAARLAPWASRPRSFRMPAGRRLRRAA